MNTSRPYNRTLLQADEFDMNEFIYLTRDLSFDRLNSCLNEHLNEVKQELGQLVNEEFNKFVRLYSEIGESGTSDIERLEQRLSKVKIEIESISAEVTSDLVEIENTSKKLDSLYEEKSVLDKQWLFLRDLATLDDLCRRGELGLACSFFVKLKSELVSLTKFLPLASEYSHKLYGVQELILTGLGEKVSQAVISGDVQSTVSIASYYQILGRWKDFEQNFSEIKVSPSLVCIISRDHPEKLLKDPSVDSGLIALFDEVTEYAQTLKNKWISPLKEICGQQLPLALNLFMEPVQERILTELAVIFSPGNPDAFQHSYNATQKFLLEILTIFSDEDSYIRSSEIWKRFQKSWQLNIYYQLRFRDFASQVEESLDSTLPFVTLSEISNSAKLEKIHQIIVLENTLDEIWSEKVLIDVLLTKFFKLTLQTCARFIDWLVSIPSEFDGTELGLSSIIVKSDMHRKLENILQKLFDDKIAKVLLDRSWETSSFEISLKRFLETKWHDGRKYLEERLHKCAILFFDKYYASQLRSGHSSAVEMIRNLKSHIDNTAFCNILSKISSTFSSKAQSEFDVLDKICKNIKRLESVMKTELSEADQSKVKQLTSMKQYILTEANALKSALAENGCVTDDLERLILSLK